MSVIEQSREMTQQEKIDWDYSYTRAGGVNKVISNPLDFAIKNCCDNCEYFETVETSKPKDEDGVCLKNVANDEYGKYIKDSDTFYCSYHKFKV